MEEKTGIKEYQWQNTGEYHPECEHSITTLESSRASCNDVSTTSNELRITSQDNQQGHDTITRYVTERTLETQKKDGSVKQTIINIIRKQPTTTEPILIEKDMFILTNAKQSTTLDRERDYSADAVQVVKEGKSPCFQVYIGRGRCDVADFGAPEALRHEVRKHPLSHHSETNKLIRDLLAEVSSPKRIQETVKSWTIDTFLKILSDITNGTTTDKQIKAAARLVFERKMTREVFVEKLARYPAHKRAKAVADLSGRRKLLENAKTLNIEALVPVWCVLIICTCRYAYIL